MGNLKMQKEEYLNLLKVIKESVDAVAGVGLGNTNYSFKVSDLIAHAEQKNENGEHMFPVQHVHTHTLADNLEGRQEDPTLGKERVKKANLDYPLIATHRDDGSLHILDGTHRLEKALHGKIDKVPVRIIPRAHMERFKTN